MPSLVLLFVLTVEIFTCSRVSGHEQTQDEGPNILQNDIFNDLSSYELVTPHIHRDGRWKRDVSTKTKVGHHSDVVKLRIYSPGRKREYIVGLKLNRVLLPLNSVAIHYDADGRLVTTPFQKLDHCFYQGSIEGLSNSTAAISTCKGIEGYIYDGIDSFYIQPVQANGAQGSQVLHIFYNMKDLKQKQHKCGQGHSLDSLDPKQVFHDSVHLHRRARRNVQTETKYVEMVMINDRKQYLKYNSNIKDTEYRAKQVANYVDSLYRPIHIRVAAVIIITWSDSDKILVQADSDKLLKDFYAYAKDGLRQVLKQANIKSYDNTMLLSNQDFAGDTVGKAYLDVMCSDMSTGIIQDHSNNAASTAATLAHEMGHNFGLGHDDDDAGCVCNDKDNLNCIMHSVSSGFKPMSTWSECSKTKINENLAKGLDVCLYNKPTKIHGDPICGNGFTEQGEECDCGTVEECNKYSDNCCNATTCMLKPGSECDEGACCKSCKFVSKGTQCREKLNECDVPESCTGTAGECPENVYIQNGKSCGNGKGYCYNGICPMQDKQCQSFWGKNAVSGPDFCYSPNTNGDVRGNCNEFADGTFQECEPEDVQCGSLHCTSGTPGVSLPRNPTVAGAGWQSYSRIFTIRGQQTVCKKLSISSSQADAPNPGKTTEGTKCGANRLCKDSKCIHLDELSWQLPLCPQNCSGHGVCTNKGYCFCDPFWTGADCATSCTSGSSCVTTTTSPPATQETTTEQATQIVTTNAPTTTPTTTPLITTLPTTIQPTTTQPTTAQPTTEAPPTTSNPTTSQTATTEDDNNVFPFTGTESTTSLTDATAPTLGTDLPPTSQGGQGGEGTAIPPTTEGGTENAINPGGQGESVGNQKMLISIVVPTIIIVLIIVVVLVLLFIKRKQLKRKWRMRNANNDITKKERHFSLTRNAEPQAVSSTHFSKVSERPGTPTSPTNLAFEFTDEKSPPVAKFSGVPPKLPAMTKPAPSRPAPQRPAPTNVNSHSGRPVFPPPSVPKPKPVSPDPSQSETEEKPVKSHQLPLQPPPHPFLKQKPVGQAQHQLPVHPPPRPLLKQKPFSQEQNQQTSSVNPITAKNHQLPINAPRHPVLKTKPVGDSDQNQREPAAKPLLPPSKPHSKPSAAINDTKHKVSPTPLPRNRSQTPPDPAPHTKPLFGQPLKPTLPVVDVNSVTGKPKPLKPPVSHKPPVHKDTEESNESARKPLKHPIPLPRKSSLEDSVDSRKPVAKIAPLQPPRMLKPQVEPKPSPAPKPMATSSAPTPAKKPPGAKVALPLPPGAKLR